MESSNGYCFFINDERMDCARDELKKYIDRKNFCNNTDKMSCNDRVEYQFVLMMQINIMLYEKHNRKEIVTKLKQAAELTIPHGTDIVLNSGEKVLLSIRELDILLEYYYVCLCVEIEEGNWEIVDYYIGHMESLFDYVQKGEWFNELSKASLQPKAVYYLMQGNIKRAELKIDKHSSFATVVDNLNNYRALIEKCNIAVGILRNVGRTYYLTELCELMESIFDKVRILLSKEICKNMDMNEIEHTVDKYQHMMLFIENISGISRYTKNSMYMYFEHNVYRLENVVLERRKLFGMSQEKLADGICTAKTIRRLELGQCKPHGYNLYEILDKLELYSDFVMEEIVSFRLEDIKNLEKLYNAISKNDIEQANNTLKILKKTLDMTYTRNRQTIQRLELNFAYRMGELTKEDYVNSLKNVLEYSVKYERIFQESNTFLTDCEAMLLQNMQNVEKDNSRMLYLTNIPLQYEQGELFIRKIELFKTMLASNVGNMGEYDKSDKEFKDIIQKNGRLKRLYNVDRCIYGLCWNNDMQRRYSIEQKEKVLNICVDISDFTKDYAHEQFYKKKINIKY